MRVQYKYFVSTLNVLKENKHVEKQKEITPQYWTKLLHYLEARYPEIRHRANSSDPLQEKDT